MIVLEFQMILRLNLMVSICDAIKRNESDVGESQIEIWPIQNGGLHKF